MTATNLPATADRPEPIRDALLKVGGVIATVVGVVTTLGTLGVLSTAQVAAITNYGAQVNDTVNLVASPVAGLIAGGLTLLGMLKAGRSATGEATPVTDPRDRDGMSLVRADGLPLGGIVDPAGGTDVPLY